MSISLHNIYSETHSDLAKRQVDGAAAPENGGSVGPSDLPQFPNILNRHLKASAYVVFSRAIADGSLVRPGACEACWRECRPHGHHDDYAQPLVVRWFCPPCHHGHHANLRRTFKEVRPKARRSVAVDVLRPSPYRTSEEARAYLQLPSLSAFYTFKSRHGLRGYRRGRAMYFKHGDLDAAFEREPATTTQHLRMVR